MRTIPHIVHFVTADQPTKAVRNRIAAISALHEGWTIHHWTDSAPPTGGLLARYYAKSNSGAQLADLMRLDAVRTFGGIYIDSDFTIERSLAPIADGYSFFVGSEDGDYPTNALFGATPNHPAIEAIVTSLLDNEPDWKKQANEATGPFLFKKICQWRTDVDILPRETFYPYNWSEAPRPPHRLSYGVHLWDGSWKPEEERHRPQLEPAPKLTFEKRVHIELAKFLSTIGFKTAGAALWNNAHGIVTAQHGDERRMVANYTVGDQVFVRTQHDTILICDGHDLSITPHLALHGHYELAEELFLKQTLSGGDWYVDVGANIGNHAILAATRVGPFGRVFAFEPNGRCSSLMRKSAIVNWVHDRLKIEELGVSDTTGEARLIFSATQLGGASIDTGELQSDCLDVTLSALGDSQNMTIATTTLDAAFPVDLPIKILKIDAEGHEPAILEGASRLVSRKAFDFILVEAIVELAGSRWAEYLSAFQKMIDCGYAVARLSEDGKMKRHATLDAALKDDTSRTLVFHALS